MSFYTQYCNKCKKKIGRFEEKFLNSMLSDSRCGVCHTLLVVKETE